MEGGAPVVGVVGDERGGQIRDAATAAGADVVAGDAEAVLARDPTAVVAVGEAAFLAVARSTPDPAVLPVDAGRGFRSVDRTDVEPAVAELVADETKVLTVPVLSVAVDGDAVGRAVADVSLVTAEAAHISEYAVATGDGRVAQFRADGVVVATPVGSTGYARRVDCPVVAAGTDVAAVAPIAPFATDPDHWVLPIDDVRLAVQRDEVSVELVTDDREACRVGVGDDVRITPDGEVSLVVSSWSRSAFG